MCELLCSTGALIGIPNGRDYRLLEPLSRQLHCDGFEFMMYSSWYDETDEMIRTLQRMHLSIPVMHCEKHIGESISKRGSSDLPEAYRHFEINCQIAQALQTEKLVIHLWDGMTSDQHFSNNLSAYPVLACIAKQYHLDLLVENVVCSCENPMKHWCTLAKIYPDVHFVFDTKMTAFHEQLDLLYQDEYAWLWKNQHIRHFHINDYAGGYKDWKNLRTLPIGQGHIDFLRFFEYIQHIGYHGTFTVESTAFSKEGTIDTDMLNQQFTYLRKALKLL